MSSGNLAPLLNVPSHPHIHQFAFSLKVCSRPDPTEIEVLFFSCGLRWLAYQGPGKNVPVIPLPPTSVEELEAPLFCSNASIRTHFMTTVTRII